MKIKIEVSVTLAGVQITRTLLITVKRTPFPITSATYSSWPRAYTLATIECHYPCELRAGSRSTLVNRREEMRSVPSYIQQRTFPTFRNRWDISKHSLTRFDAYSSIQFLLYTIHRKLETYIFVFLARKRIIRKGCFDSFVIFEIL